MARIKQNFNFSKMNGKGLQIFAPKPKKLKWTKTQQIAFTMALANELVKSGKMNESVFKSYKILEKDSKATKERKATGMMNDMLLNNRNFIIINHINMIRTQTYINLAGDLITDTKYGFFKSEKGNGEYIIVEDIPVATTRSGVIMEDMANLSEPPRVENQLLMFLLNKAIDTPKNIELEKWATLEGATTWLNDRLALVKNGLDFPVSKYLKDQINHYSGFANIVIDTTDMKYDKQRMKVLQKTIGHSLLIMSDDYRDVYNESIEGETTNFYFKINREDFALIFNTETIIVNEIEYFRQTFTPLTENQKDWGVGTLFTQDLADGVEVKILCWQKFMWGAQYGNGETPLAFALQTLSTEYVFYGSVWIKSAPALNISFGTQQSFGKMLDSKIEFDITNLKEVITLVENKKEQEGIKDFAVKKSTLLKDLKIRLEFIEKNKQSYKQTILDRTEFKNGLEILSGDQDEIKQNNSNNISLQLENIELKLEVLKLKSKDLDLSQKEVQTILDEIKKIEKKEKSKVEKPKVEKPKDEKPKVEKPKDEKPKDEKPKDSIGTQDS